MPGYDYNLDPPEETPYCERCGGTLVRSRSTGAMVCSDPEDCYYDEGEVNEIN